MANPWWKKKSEPATDYDYDDVYYGNSAKNTDAQPSEDGYDTYADNGDVNEVGVAWSEEDAKAVAKANEPLMKKTFAPNSCQDSPAIVDAFKEGRVVVICVEELDRENFLRLFDYVMGAVHALDGKLIRADRDTVVLLPYDVEEDVSVDELEEDTEEEVDYGKKEG
jgi:FtsZ-interacting cell division protein YlmF